MPLTKTNPGFPKWCQGTHERKKEPCLSQILAPSRTRWEFFRALVLALPHIPAAGLFCSDIFLGEFLQQQVIENTSGLSSAPVMSVLGDLYDVLVLFLFFIRRVAVGRFWMFGCSGISLESLMAITSSIVHTGHSLSFMCDNNLAEQI